MHFLCMQFQSPIGTQKTGVFMHDLCQIYVFQSPIGTQKTLELAINFHFAFWFQSPIGTQKTYFHIYKALAILRCFNPL